ncbi:sensor histidine kinase [Paractinoplanes brasiliensis]|uniref:histidine kinase n=1 Tax=Paractinoplanes brasiliensis TaxID=52695 RepID=A0A4R6JSC3_9ACTN|nr:histidine kinase [Actinoplanes brasiliensis]TDO37535.1 signal transduction histidine kinase [Actinoplanes brasiliensis]GID31897.1 two-component sensor histidine kinase [Actinoplanes brasiliensis]
METIGPVTRRNATGPLRRLFWSREPARPVPYGRFWNYALPLGLLGLSGLGLVAGANLADTRPLNDLMVVLIAAGSVLPVVITLRLPVIAWRLAFLMLFVGSVMADPKESWPWNTVQILGFLVVIGRLAIAESSGLTLWAVAFSLIPVFVYAPYANAWGAAVLLVAIGALGDIVSRRRRTRALLAEKEELTELERAKRAVLEERTRIAREMHDVVAHHMSMIAVRAETAPYRVGELSEPAKAELATIADAAREALTDMRRLLGVLRAEEGEAPLEPQPGLAQLGDLIAGARAAGVEVTYHTSGFSRGAVDNSACAAEPVDNATPALAKTDRVPTLGGGAAELTAYRIVQEALANAARHAPGGAVTLDVDGGPDRLELVIRNKLTGPVAARKGHGLAGMRERAELLGGTLTAAAEDGHFVVRANLPWGEQQ